MEAGVGRMLRELGVMLAGLDAREGAELARSHVYAPRWRAG